MPNASGFFLARIAEDAGVPAAGCFAPMAASFPASAPAVDFSAGYALAFEFPVDSTSAVSFMAAYASAFLAATSRSMDILAFMASMTESACARHA